MTAGVPFPAEATPYSWETNHALPQDTLRLWTEVGNGIDKNQTGACTIKTRLLIEGSHSCPFTSASFLAVFPAESEAGAKWMRSSVHLKM